jgi:hypothetical protein
VAKNKDVPVEKSAPTESIGATTAQVQNYVDKRIRVRCGQIRALLLAMEDDKRLVDDIYSNLTSSPTWVDSNSDNPPHLMTPADVLAWNTFITNMIAAMRGDAQLPVVLKSCSTPI